MTDIAKRDRIIANLKRRGLSTERIAHVAWTAKVRLFNRGQYGAHVWGLVYLAATRF